MKYGDQQKINCFAARCKTASRRRTILAVMILRFYSVDYLGVY